MHDSGTGGSSSLANFPLFVVAGCKGDDINGCVFPKNQRSVGVVEGSVSARPGYFAIGLQSGINAEMTVSNHTALYKFTVHGNATGNAAVDGPLKPLIFLDLIDLSNSRKSGEARIDSKTGRMTGSGTFVPSFGVGRYTLHYCADFQGGSIRDTGVFVNTRGSSEFKNITMYEDDGAPIPAGTVSDAPVQ